MDRRRQFDILRRRVARTAGEMALAQELSSLRGEDVTRWVETLTQAREELVSMARGR